MRRAVVCATTIALALASVPTSVLAIAGNHTSVVFWLPSAYPAIGRALVKKALERDDCKFLGCQHVNGVSTLRYAGGTKALNAFLADLTKCPKTTTAIRFRQSLGDADWEVRHDARGSAIHAEVAINLSSKECKLVELVLPSVTSP